MTFPEELISRDQAGSDFSVTCPYLGTMPDPHTSVAYPSGANLCHRADDSQLVSLAHQSQHCLVEAYDSCPTFREDHIPVASIDVGGPVRKKVNWQRPLAIIAIILLFGVVTFGAYALFSPFQAEPVDASVPAIQESEETILASNDLPTPTLVGESEEAVVDADQTEALIENSDIVDTAPVAAADDIVDEESAPTGSSSDGASEDAKMAPVSETPTPTALPDAADDAIGETNTTFESLPETKPLPTAGAGSEETEQPAAAATAVFTDDPATSATAVPSPTVAGDIADGTAVIQTGALNVRRGPGPQFPAFTRAHNGEYVTLLGRNGDSSWVKVRLFNGYEGWIYTEYIAAGQSLDDLPYIPRSQR